NGEPGVVLLGTRQPGVGVMRGTADVEDALAAVATALPAGVRVDRSMFRQATFVHHALGNLTRALLVGGALVLLVLLVFLGHLRAALVSVVALPVALLAAIARLR